MQFFAQDDGLMMPIISSEKEHDDGLMMQFFAQDDAYFEQKKI